MTAGLWISLCWACAALLSPRGDDEGWRVVLKSGETLHGQLLRQDASQVELITARGVLVLKREKVRLVERLKGSVTPRAGTTAARRGSAGRGRTARAPAAALPSFRQAELIQAQLAKKVVALRADQPLAFRTAELGRGRWKWPAAKGMGFTFAAAPPDPRVRDAVGPLIYHLEVVGSHRDLRWIPLRWEPSGEQWSIREYCPPALAAHRALVDLHARIEELNRKLGRLEDYYESARGRAIAQEMRLAKLARARSMIARAREEYCRAAARAARRFLPAIETVAPAPPSRPEAIGVRLRGEGDH